MRISKETLRYGLASGILVTAAIASWALSSVRADEPGPPSSPDSPPHATCLTPGSISSVSIGEPLLVAPTAEEARVAFLQDVYPELPTSGWIVESETPTRVEFSLLVGTVKQAYAAVRYEDGLGWWGTEASACSLLLGPPQNPGEVPQERTFGEG